MLLLAFCSRFICELRWGEHVLVAAEVEIARHGAVVADQLLELEAGAGVPEAGLRAELLDFEEGEEVFAEQAGFQLGGAVEGVDVHDGDDELEDGVGVG